MSDTENYFDETSATADDYKDFFLKKFSSLMTETIDFLIANIESNTTVNNKLEKINDTLKNKNIAYPRLIERVCKNEKILSNLTILRDSNINDTVMNELLKNTDKKEWVLIPEFHIDNIIKELQNKELITTFIDKIKNIYVSAQSYVEIDKMISENDGDDSNFDPVEHIKNSERLKNINVESMFKDVKYKQMSSYEMLIRMMVDEKTENTVGEYMNNIKEDDVNEAASKLDDVLKTTESNNDASKLLGTMLTKIKDKVIEMGQNNSTEDLDGKAGMENIINIAKIVAGDMSRDVKESGLTPAEIWDATSSLAKKTVKSDALDVVDGIIRQNIFNNMNKDNVEIVEDNVEDIHKKLKELDDEEN